jgi:hypothetical protein
MAPTTPERITDRQRLRKLQAVVQLLAAKVAQLEKGATSK